MLIARFRMRCAPLVVETIVPGKVEAPVAVLGKKLLVPLAEGEQAGLACYSTDGPPGQALWQLRLPAGVHQSPAAEGDTVWCVDGKPHAVDRKMYALDIATGKERWQAPVDAQGSGALLATEDRLLVHDHGGKLASLSHKGERQWEQWLGEMQHAPAVTKTMVIAAGVNPPVLVALDRPTGSVLWRRPLEAVPTTSPVVHKERIYLGTQRGLEGRSILDGRPVNHWNIDESGVSADFALLRDLAVYVNNHGELIVVETSAGAVMSKTSGATVGRPPLVSRDTVLCIGKKGLLRVSLQDAKLALPAFGAGTPGLLWSPFGHGPLLVGSALFPGRAQKLTPEVWLDAAELGSMTSPLVLADGHVYAGKAGSGLVKMGN